MMNDRIFGLILFSKGGEEMRKLILSGCLVILAIVAIVVVLLPRIPISLGNFSEADITKIHVVDGGNGEVTEIPKEGFPEVYELTKNMNRLFGGPVDFTGWDYKVIIFANDKEYSVEVISEDTVIIDGKVLSIDSESGRRLKETVKKYGALKTEVVGDVEHYFTDKAGNNYTYSIIGEKDKSICLHHIATKQSEFTIPAQIDGWKVVRVGQFYAELSENPAVDINHNIRALTFSPGIKEIGESAFAEDEEAKGVLSAVDLGTVGKIRNSAFANSSLEKLSLPRSVYEVGENAFSECENLKEVTVANPAIELKDGAFGSSGIENLELPKRMTGKIGAWCFDNIAIRTLRWPEFSKKDAKNIDTGAFSWCKALTKVVFPENQEHIYIENGVFGECKKLTELTFPKTTGKVTYRTNLYADNYKHSCKTLNILGKDTELKGITTAKEDYELLTVGEIKAPAGSKAIKYAKKAKRMVKISEKLLNDKEWGGDGEILPEYYMESGEVVYGKMKVKETKI